MRRLKSIFIAFLIIFMFSLSMFAQVGNDFIPTMINYQGFLTDQNGATLTGSYQITFSLYEEANPGNPWVWQEIHSAVTVESGLFNVLLGSIDTLSANDLKGERYLGIKVGGEVEMTPRLRLASAAYSLNAENANNAQNAIYADSSNHAQNATHSDAAQNAIYADTSQNALNADSAKYAINADTSQNAVNAVTANTANNALAIENFRFVSGLINANGTVSSGNGFTSTYTTTGTYTITFVPAFTSPPTVIVTGVSSTAVDNWWIVGNITNSDVMVFSYDHTGTSHSLQDCAFNFIATGPR